MGLFYYGPHPGWGSEAWTAFSIQGDSIAIRSQWQNIFVNANLYDLTPGNFDVPCIYTRELRGSVEVIEATILVYRGNPYIPLDSEYSKTIFVHTYLSDVKALLELIRENKFSNRLIQDII